MGTPQHSEQSAAEISVRSPVSVLETDDETDDDNFNANEEAADEVRGEEETDVVQLITKLKLTAVSLLSLAGAIFISRKMAAKASLWAMDNRSPNEMIANSAQMASAEAQMVPSNFKPGCVDCSKKSVKTLSVDTSQRNASKGAIRGARDL